MNVFKIEKDLSRLSARIEQKKLGEYAGKDQVISASQMLVQLQSQPASIIKLKSFIESLDKYIHYFAEGELIAISGPTKSGKTLLAQTLTQSFMRQQYYPLWFSYEVPPRQFLSQFKDPPMIFMPSRLKAHALDWFEDRVLESFAKYRTRVIFIDHLHFLIDLARLRNPSLEIGQVIRRLKSLAVEGEFIIFLLCHTKMGASEDRLSYESIRDSSFISQESDSVFMIKRTPKDGILTARLTVEFHRRTGVLEQVVYLVKAGDKLGECSQVEEGLRDGRRNGKERAAGD